MSDCTLRPIGVSMVAMWLTKNQKKVSNNRANRSSGPEWHLAHLATHQHRPMVSRRHQGDLSP